MSSFAGSGTIHLPGTPPNRQPLKICDRHGGLAEQHGGVQKGSKWICAKCWRQTLGNRNLKSNLAKKT